RRAVLDHVHLEAPQVLSARGVGRGLEEGSETAYCTKIAGLRLGLELAHAHVLEHALAQRRDGRSRDVHGPAPVDERGGLPRSTTSQNPAAHRATALAPERLPRE